MLLRLGASGVQQVVDVTSPTGWSRLRQVVGQPATRAVSRIQGPILSALADAPPDARLFVEAMIRLAPDTPTVTALAERLYVRPSTLMSRFARAGLPSPKNYLSAIRLLHAAYLFEASGLSVADVAYRLEYSSPQSFGRHLRAMLGVTALEFRRRFPFPVALERFVELMVEPYREVWRDFHPVAGVQGGVEVSPSTVLVLPQHLLEPVVGQRRHHVAVRAPHRLRGQHRVDDRFLCGLHRRLVHRVDPVLAQHLHRPDPVLARRSGARRGEGDEEVARCHARDAAHAPDAERGSPRHAAELVRQQGRVGGDDHDDGVLVPSGPAAPDRAALGRARRVEVGPLVALPGSVIS